MSKQSAFCSTSKVAISDERIDDLLKWTMLHHYSTEIFLSNTENQYIDYLLSEHNGPK